MHNVCTTKRWPRIMEIWQNSNQWIISIKKDNNWIITMADKNLGATDVWYPWDILHDWVCWDYYQWWNNHPFKYENQTKTSNVKVDVSQYWPWNYYDDDTFRVSTTIPKTYQNPENSNMRWDDDDTFEARRWPCPEWYHIPSEFEASQLFIWQEVLKYCLVPNSWFIFWWDWSATARGNLQWQIWTSSQRPNIYSPFEMYWCKISWRWFSSVSWYRVPTTTWQNIRPFKNNVVEPDWSSDWVMLNKLIIKWDPVI